MNDKPLTAIRNLGVFFSADFISSGDGIKIIDDQLSESNALYVQAGGFRLEKTIHACYMHLKGNCKRSKQSVTLAQSLTPAATSAPPRIGPKQHTNQLVTLLPQ